MNFNNYPMNASLKNMRPRFSMFLITQAYKKLKYFCHENKYVEFSCRILRL